MLELIPCPFCREMIPDNAIKCRYCHEFISNNHIKGSELTRKFVFSNVLTLFGKSFIPITIIVLAFVFKPAIEGLLKRASHAEFMGSKLVFEQTKAFVGTLTPTELFYLIWSANNYGVSLSNESSKSVWNLDMLEKDGRVGAIYALKNKGLVEYNTFDTPLTLTLRGYGKKSIAAKPTEKGKDFLIELGLEFDGKTFVGAP